MKNAKRIISLITVLAMIAVMFSAVGFNTAAEDITYIGRTSPEAYAWLENADGVRDDTLVIADAAVDNQPGGKKIKNAEGEFVSGAMVFRFTEDVKNLSMQAGYSTSDYLGRVTVEASADGKNFTPVDMTLVSQSGYYWGGASVHQNEIYASVNDFTSEQHIRYIRINVPCKTQFAAPGLTSISYNTYGDVLESYDFTVPANNAVVTEGELLYGDSYGSDFYYFNPSGSIVFSSANYATITDFSARVLLHNPNKGTSLIAQVSSDGVNYSSVSLAFKDTGNYNSSWDCSEYEVYGSLSEDDGIKYIKFNLKNTITCAAGIRNLKCNEADTNIIYLNSFDIAAGATTDGNVISASPAGGGGYLLTKDGNAVSGSMIYYDEDGITNFTVEYAQVFGIYGEISIWASVDGSDWVRAAGSDVNTGNTYAGDTNCHKHVFTGTLLPSAGYKYIKIEIAYGEANPNFPAVFSIRYNKASQLSRPDPSESESELKDSYDVTLSANDESIVKTPDYEGAVFSSASVATLEISSDHYAFYQDSASRSGWIDIYSGGVITDFRIDAFTGNMNIYNGQLQLLVSSDGQNWLPTAPAGNTVYDQRPTWGDLWGRSFYGTLKENENIHYIRIIYTTSGMLKFLPAVRSISYNYVPIEDSCDEVSNVYEIAVNATDAEATPYVEGAQYRVADAQIPSFYAFFDESGAWQPGEIIFTSESAITEYQIDAFSGNTPNYGMLKFSASSDGINYVNINPSKYTYDTRGSWGDMAGNYFYGKLLASADIHYIKVEYVEKGTWIQFAPAVRMMSYNTVDSCESIGHDYVLTQTVPATCTEDGYTECVCSHCDDVKTETIAATGHKFTNYVSDGNVTPTTDGTKTATCDNGCGATDTIVDEGSRLVCVDEEIADFDNDGEITAVDYTTMRKNLMSGISGDVNGDGVTDILDLIRFKNYLLSAADGPVIDAGGSTDTPANMD